MMMKSTHIVIMGWICLCEVDKQVIVVRTKKKREDGGAVEVGREENSRSSHVLSRPAMYLVVLYVLHVYLGPIQREGGRGGDESS